MYLLNDTRVLTLIPEVAEEDEEALLLALLLLSKAPTPTLPS